MVLKLKSQLEELRSRVAFLECVKKYLQVRTQLLPSLRSAAPEAANVSLCVGRS